MREQKNTLRLVWVVLFLTFALNLHAVATTYRYEGNEVRSLVTVVNNHNTAIEALRDSFLVLVAKLDADTGVVDTNYASDSTITTGVGTGANAPITVDDLDGP